ncbi:hypothetical protein [Phyllobacterium phragmitis]|nr:hypothetical protein [Phyllobacterium phragmitis]
MIDVLDKFSLNLLSHEDQKIAVSHLESIMEQALNARHVFFAYLLGMAVIELRSIIKEGSKSPKSTSCRGHRKSEEFFRHMQQK